MGRAGQEEDEGGEAGRQVGNLSGEEEEILCLLLCKYFPGMRIVTRTKKVRL